MTFQNFKSHVMSITTLEKDALHVYVGISLFLFTLAVLKNLYKRKLRLTFYRLHPDVRPQQYRWIALVVVVAFAILGEILDYREIINKKYWHYQDNLHDIINTSFWPFVLYGLMKWTDIFKK